MAAGVDEKRLSDILQRRTSEDWSVRFANIVSAKQQTSRTLCFRALRPDLKGAVG